MQPDYYLLWLVLRMKVCEKVGPVADPTSPYRHQSASILAMLSAIIDGSVLPPVKLPPYAHPHTHQAKDSIVGM